MDRVVLAGIRNCLTWVVDNGFQIPVTNFAIVFPDAMTKNFLGNLTKVEKMLSEIFRKQES